MAQEPFATPEQLFLHRAMAQGEDVIDRAEAAAFLKAVRGVLGQSQTEFAKLVKASRRTLWSAEAGGDESVRSVSEDKLRGMVAMAARHAPNFIAAPAWERKQSKQDVRPPRSLMTKQKNLSGKRGS